MVLCFQLVEVISQVSKRCKSEFKPPCKHTQKANKSTVVFLGFFRKIHGLFFGEPPDAHFPHQNFSAKERSLFFLAAGASSSGCQRGVKMRFYQETLQRADWLSSNFSSTKTFRGATKPRTLKGTSFGSKENHINPCQKMHQEFLFFVFSMLGV